MSRMIRQLAAAALMTAALGTGAALAENRVVVVNGVLMSPAQLQQLDARAGSRVPNGKYWLDYDTGIWGYAGNPYPQGRIGVAAQPAGPGYNPPAYGGDPGGGSGPQQTYDGTDQSWWDNQAAQERAVESFDRQAIQDQRTYIDPSTGQEHDLSNQYNYYWADQQGNVSGTNTYQPPDNSNTYNQLETTE